jgi:hypothetical protein
MENSKTPIPQLKQKILGYLDKIQGNGHTKLIHHLREKDENSVLKNSTYQYRSLSNKRSNYKSKPLEKFIILPPDYKMRKLKPVTPIKSGNDNSVIYQTQAGHLIIPRDRFFKISNTLSSPRPLNKTLNLSDLNNRINKISTKKYLKTLHRPKLTLENCKHKKSDDLK